MGKIMRNGIEYGGGLPTGGTPGQVLTKTATGAEWADVQGGSGRAIAVGIQLLHSAVVMPIRPTQEVHIEEGEPI